MSPLALTVAIALLASLLLSIFVIPVLCALVLRPGPEKESPVMRRPGLCIGRSLPGH